MIKQYKVNLDMFLDDDEGISCISFVDTPAVLSNFVKLSKVEDNELDNLMLLYYAL